MNKSHSEALSARIRDVINPPRRQTATARILDGVEPLPVVKPFVSEEQQDRASRVSEVEHAFAAEPTLVTETPPVTQTPLSVSHLVPHRHPLSQRHPLKISLMIL